MLKKLFQTKKVEVIDDIICNKCGETMLKTVGPWDEHGEFYGLQEASFSTGYLSKDFPDGKVYSFSMCEPCLKWLFELFELPPSEREYF